MDGQQDLASNTGTVEDVDFSGNPWFQIEVPVANASTAGIAYELEQVRVEGSFAEDGSYIGGIRVEALVDTRSFHQLIDESDPGAVCDAVTSLGLSCVACTDGETYCLEVVVDQVTGEERHDIELVAVTDGSAACATVAAGAPLAWWGLALLARRRRPNPTQ
jgi:hypothetical protein